MSGTIGDARKREAERDMETLGIRRADCECCFIADEIAFKQLIRRVARNAWELGYLRGVRDEAGDLDRADNPYADE